MTRNFVRKVQSLRVVVLFVGIVTFLLAMACFAQVRNTSTTSAKSPMVSAAENAIAPMVSPLVGGDFLFGPARVDAYHQSQLSRGWDFQGKQWEDCAGSRQVCNDDSSCFQLEPIHGWASSDLHSYGCIRWVERANRDSSVRGWNNHNWLREIERRGGGSYQVQTRSRFTLDYSRIQRGRRFRAKHVSDSDPGGEFGRRYNSGYFRFRFAGSRSNL